MVVLNARTAFALICVISRFNGLILWFYQSDGAIELRLRFTNFVTLFRIGALCMSFQDPSQLARTPLCRCKR